MQNTRNIPGLERALADFGRDFKETIAIVGGTDVVYRKFGCEFSIYPELNDAVNQYILVHKISSSDAQEKMVRSITDEIYRTLCKVFIRLRDRDAFTFPVESMTPELEAETEHMEVWAGLRQSPPKPLPPKSTEQLLEETVVSDFETLPTDKFRMKLSGNVAYRQMYEKLAIENRLQAERTSKYGIGQVGA